MVGSVGADMDFLGVLRKKEKFELMKNLCNSEGIQNDQSGLNSAVAATTAEAKDNSKKGSFISQLRDGVMFEEHGEEEKGFPSWISTVNGVSKRSVAEYIPRSLDLSVVGKCSSSINLFTNQSGFGSPIGLKGGFDHKTWLDDNQAVSSGHVMNFRPKQSRAQLTIFYGGTVNVYNDIPANKAQAILLIAGGGNYCNYPIIPVAPKGRESQITELKTLHPRMELSKGSQIQHAPASWKMYADLPLARKYSLQRFLEKRKDRLNANAKSPYSTVAAADNSKFQQYAPSPSSAIRLD